MKKPGKILITSLLVFILLAGATVAVAIARPRLQNKHSNPEGILLYHPNGNTSVTFENVGDSYTFYMTVKNNGGYDIQVTIDMDVGGDTLYFSYKPDNWPTVINIGPYRIKSFSLKVKAIAQSIDTPESIRFYVTATSGIYSDGTLTFEATIEPGPGGDPSGNEQSEVVLVNQQNNNNNYNQY
jgi:hypothetical protein